MDRPDGPVWVVARVPGGVSVLSRGRAAPLSRHYHLVAEGCDRRVYVRNVVLRPDPSLRGDCSPSEGPWGGLFDDVEGFPP
jgi:hypothetical protein